VKNPELFAIDLSRRLHAFAHRTRDAHHRSGKPPKVRLDIGLIVLDESDHQRKKMEIGTVQFSSNAILQVSLASSYRPKDTSDSTRFM
jgi:hypothetical protein